MRTLDDAGATIERTIDALRTTLERSSMGPALLGAALAIAVVAAGLTAFIAVFAILVGLFS